MKKFVLIAVLVLFATVAFAKDIALTVTFEYDVAFEEETESFNLYYQNQLNPDTFVLVADTTDVTMRVWVVPVFDLAPGKTSQFFVEAVYKDGTKEMSPPFAYKFTGKPVIKDIRKR